MLPVHDPTLLSSRHRCQPAELVRLEYGYLMKITTVRAATAQIPLERSTKIATRLLNSSVATGEIHATRSDFRDLIAQRAGDFFQPHSSPR
jgi:hypothetical protein